VVVGLILNLLDIVDEDLLAPLNLNFVISDFLKGDNDWLDEVISLLLCLTILSNWVLKNEISELALNNSMQVLRLTKLLNNFVLDIDWSFIDTHFNELGWEFVLR